MQRPKTKRRTLLLTRSHFLARGWRPSSLPTQASWMEGPVSNACPTRGGTRRSDRLLDRNVCATCVSARIMGGAGRGAQDAALLSRPTGHFPYFNPAARRLHDSSGPAVGMLTVGAGCATCCPGDAARPGCNAQHQRRARHRQASQPHGANEYVHAHPDVCGTSYVVQRRPAPTSSMCCRCLLHTRKLNGAFPIAVLSFLSAHHQASLTSTSISGKNTLGRGKHTR